LAVPGMPVGAPGMEMGGRKDACQVIGIDTEGKDSVVADYCPGAGFTLGNTLRLYGNCPAATVESSYLI